MVNYTSLYFNYQLATHVVYDVIVHRYLSVYVQRYPIYRVFYIAQDTLYTFAESFIDTFIVKEGGSGNKQKSRKDH
jgi:hypothetical protein